jgi:predicted transcriptional regulator
MVKPALLKKHYIFQCSNLGEKFNRSEIQYFMQNSIVNIELYETVFTAAQKMAYKKVGALLVTEMGKVKGILSESAMTMDVVARCLDVTTNKVSSVLNRQLINIEQSQSMSDAYQLMRDKRKISQVSFLKKTLPEMYWATILTQPKLQLPRLREYPAN